MNQQFTHEFWKVNDDYAYLVKFDDNLDLTDSWIDSQTMNFFNAQRDNIFVSSSKYDIVTLRSVKAQYHANSEEKI